MKGASKISGGLIEESVALKTKLVLVYGREVFIVIEVLVTDGNTLELTGLKVPATSTA